MKRLYCLVCKQSDLVRDNEKEPYICPGCLTEIAQMLREVKAEEEANKEK